MQFNRASAKNNAKATLRVHWYRLWRNASYDFCIFKLLVPFRSSFVFLVFLSIHFILALDIILHLST